MFKAYCVTEPGAGSDVSGLKTKAEKHGDEVQKNILILNFCLNFLFSPFKPKSNLL